MNKPRILVVEDEKIVYENIVISLIDLGYMVSDYHITTGEEAIEKINEIQPDLILMDIDLRGSMNGIEAAKIIKERFEIPVIFLSVYSDDRTLSEAIKAEPFGYLLKPYEDAEIHAVIEVALYKNRATKKLKEYVDLLSKTVEKNSNAIIRYIEFPLEYHQAGLSILNYFGRILSQKYPDENIKVRIEQENLVVRMIIETPSGKKEEYEKVLYDYGQVIQGKLAPEMLLSDSVYIMELKHKLDMAAIEFKHTQELLDYQKKNYDNRIESLELEVSKLFAIIDENLKGNQNLQNIMNSLINKYEGVKSISEALKTLMINIKKDDITENDKKNIETAYNIIIKEPSLKDQIQDLILKGMISGPAGNFLTQLLLSAGNLF